MESKENFILSSKDRFEIIKLEIQILQSRFDKYDDLIYRSRSWFASIIVSLLGVGVTIDNPKLFLICSIVVVFFYITEVIWRVEYWYQYVVRYRFLRDTLNKTNNIGSVSLYDLTNSYHEKPSLAKSILHCLNNVEMIVFYCFWFLLTLFLAFLI